MMFEIHRARFLKASELLQELIVLQQLRSGNSLACGPLANSELTDAIVRSHVARLQSGGMVESRLKDGETVIELNAAGEQQLRVLMVDYMRELMLLHEEMIGIFRKKLAEFYLGGVRRVAFYPVGDTAEVVYLALQASGLSLELAVDDDPLLWGSKFHELSIRAPSTLIEAEIDGVILTTSVFEDVIRRRMEATSPLKIKLFSLW
jgi:hypothetical protein